MLPALVGIASTITQINLDGFVGSYRGAINVRSQCCFPRKNIEY